MLCQKHNQESHYIRNILKIKKKELGGIKYAEVVTLVLFVLLVLSWFFLDPGFIDGWASIFTDGYIGAAVPSILISLLLFIIPDKLYTPSDQEVTTLIDWNTVQHKLPWMVMFIIGGGGALADAALVSGLSNWLGMKLMLFSNLPQWLMLSIICLIVALMTECITNTAACTLLLPVVAPMAESMDMNPLYLMFPVTLATEFAFMLPTSASSTALALSTGRVHVTDMMKIGLLLNLIGTCIIVTASHTWGMMFFKLNEVPWAAENTTTSMSDLT